MEYGTFTVQGLSPMLMHRFPEEEAEQATSGKRRARDQNLSPRDLAAPCLYEDLDKTVGWPGYCLYRGLMEAGRFIQIKRSKLSTRDSSLIPSGVWMVDEFVPVDPQTWEVDIRPVVIPATKGRILRYRPRFDDWKLTFTLEYDPDRFSFDTVHELVEKFGRMIGVGDFRPSRRGTFGRFFIAGVERKDNLERKG
jgi:hypothetical protein